MDCRGRVESGLTAAKCPGASLLVACCEEGDQVQFVAQAPNDLVQRRPGAVPKRLRVFGREIGKFCFELQIEAVRTVFDRQERLRRQRLELGRQLTVPVDQRVTCIDVCEQTLELRDLDLQLRLAGLRLLRDAFESALDVVAVGHENLEPERFEIVRGNARARKAVEDDEQCVDLAQVS